MARDFIDPDAQKRDRFFLGSHKIQTQLRPRHPQPRPASS
jgi:hypothetical protein